MHLSGSLKTSVHAFAKLTPSSVASHKNNTQKDTTMTDLSLWQSASLPNTVDHVLERYHAPRIAASLLMPCNWRKKWHRAMRISLLIWWACSKRLKQN